MIERTLAISVRLNFFKVDLPLKCLIQAFVAEVFSASFAKNWIEHD